jgi:drug/metabolite transporter (DMT)-like permease
MVTQVKRVWTAGSLSAIVSLLAYWIVLWASTQAPLALVAAVREASMVFAVIFGVVFLHEKLDWRRLISVFLAMTGTVLLKTSK